MIEGKPSATAMGAALHRAAHQLFDGGRIFADPLALRIVGAEAAEALRSGRSRHASPSRLRTFLAVRSRFTEDSLAEAVGRGVRQYVLLGAGLDTFAYRNRDLRLRITEIDHPATQAWKRERLAEAGIAVPDNVTLAPVDFERETVADGLARASLDFAAPAFVAWLGVVPYLERKTVFGVLGYLARHLAPGSEVVFDYPAIPETLTEAQREAAGALAARVAAAGEPFRTAFRPQELGHALTGLGIGWLEDQDGAALAARYCDGPDALSPYAHIVRARIGGPGRSA